MSGRFRGGRAPPLDALWLLLRRASLPSYWSCRSHAVSTSNQLLERAVIEFTSLCATISWGHRSVRDSRTVSPVVMEAFKWIDGGIMIRDGHEPRVESHERHGQGLPFSEPRVKSAFQRSTPGILIFSRKRQLPHMNRRALELTGHFHQAEHGPVNKIRSAPVQELRFHIQEALDRRSAANIWEVIELKRVIFEAGRKMLVRGFGLADRNSCDDSSIVIVLEEVGHQEEGKAQ